MATKITAGKVYTHLESNRHAVVTGTGQMLKDGRWTRSVTYTTLDNDKSWTRDQKSFADKFAATCGS